MATEAELVGYTLITVIVLVIVAIFLKIVRSQSADERRRRKFEQGPQLTERKGESLGFKSLCPNCLKPVPPTAQSCESCRTSFWSPLIEESTGKPDDFEEEIHRPKPARGSKNSDARMEFFDDDEFIGKKAVCPACDSEVGYDSRRCKRCGERYWSPIIEMKDDII